MISYSIKMAFILQEEIARLGNASDYELLVLKSHIENIIYTKRKLESLIAQISVGAILHYFDTQLLKEDTLLVTDLGEVIKGIRQSDKKHIYVEPQSFNLDYKANLQSVGKNRTRIQDEWKLPCYYRVFADCYSYFLKGYFIKYNHNGCKLKLLGGDTVKLPSSAIFYEPSPDDINDFLRIENDPLLQNLEYEKTLEIVLSKVGQLDPSNSPIDNRKLIRFMTGRGYFLHYIEQAIEAVFGKRQEELAP
jgi:hypothetical protein